MYLDQFLFTNEIWPSLNYLELLYSQDGRQQQLHKK